MTNGDINPRAREFEEYRQPVRELCAGFDGRYWQQVEERSAYPEEFVKALTAAGWLAALIPTEYGGGGLGVTEASVILEEINRSGGNSGACHAQMYIMGTLLRHGSVEQKARYLPKIASGELRLQSFAVTEPTTGTDTTKIKTFATRKNDHYVVNGQKVWISRVQHSDLMLLLARTTALSQVKRKSDGLSVFLVDLRGAEANMAKLLAADASWEAANVCLQTYGGFGFAAEYDVERKFRETRLYQVAPVSTNLILSYIGEHVLGMPRSF